MLCSVAVGDEEQQHYYTLSHVVQESSSRNMKPRITPIQKISTNKQYLETAIIVTLWRILPLIMNIIETNNPAER